MIFLLNEMNRLIVAAIATPPRRRRLFINWSGVMSALPTHSDMPLVNTLLNDFNDEMRKLAPLSAALEQSDLAISWYMFHIKALVAILNGDINRYAEQVATLSGQRVAQSYRDLRSGERVIMIFALLAVVITAFAGWYIYRNLGTNLTAISRAMSRPGVRRSGRHFFRRYSGVMSWVNWRAPLTFFARNTESLERTSRLLKEKTTQMEIAQTERQGVGRGAITQPETESGRATDGRAGP